MCLRRPSMEAGDLLLEIDRQTALLIYQILETPEERQFDDIVFLASEVCSTPIALVSFLEEGRQWFKARVGFPMCETDISSSVCRFVVEAESPLVIPDLSQDPRKSDNPLVTDRRLSGSMPVTRSGPSTACSDRFASSTTRHVQRASAKGPWPAWPRCRALQSTALRRGALLTTTRTPCP